MLGALKLAAQRSQHARADLAGEHFHDTIVSIAGASAIFAGLQHLTAATALCLAAAMVAA